MMMIEILLKGPLQNHDGSFHEVCRISIFTQKYPSAPAPGQGLGELTHFRPNTSDNINHYELKLDYGIIIFYPFTKNIYKSWKIPEFVDCHIKKI